LKHKRHVVGEIRMNITERFRFIYVIRDLPTTRDVGPAARSGDDMSVFVEFSFPVTAFPPGGTLRTYGDVTVEVERVVPAGSPAQCLWVEGDDSARLLDDLVDGPAVDDVDVLSDLDDRTLARVHWQDGETETPVSDAIESHGAVVVEATGTEAGWQVLLRFLNATSVAAFYQECRRRGIDVGLDRVGGSVPDGEDRHGLSAPQQETLQVAFETGYFEIPRGTTLEALADELGVSEQAVSERLRRGLGALLDGLLREPKTNDVGGENDDSDDATSPTDG
jgi:predicted DNA binding protein